jgi:zinc transporter, ZIP family
MTRAIVQIGGPFLALLLLVAAFFAYEPLRKPFGGTPPPVEALTVERTVLDESGIAFKVRSGGTEPLSIVQVEVDGAFWSFTQDPPGAVPRLSGAWISIPYPWVEGETHKIIFVTRTGLTFEHTIDVAWPTPKVGTEALGRLTLAGLFLGVLPIALGMLFYPALKSGGAVAFQFAMALTLGLLAFLLVDTLSEALEIAGRAAPGLKSALLVWIIATLACMLLWGVAHWRGQELTYLGLAASIAFAIGVHNLGEGLAVGSAFATGAAALGGFLLLGFTVHNVTEGIGIVTPMLDRRPSLLVLAGLVGLAGLPAVLGLWFGTFAFTNHWAALALALGAGAILHVIIEVGLLLRRQIGQRTQSRSYAVIFGGLVVGVALMYLTGLLVQI